MHGKKGGAVLAKTEKKTRAIELKEVPLEILCTFASTVRNSATTTESAGTGTCPCWSHQVNQIRQSDWREFWYYEGKGGRWGRQLQFPPLYAAIASFLLHPLDGTASGNVETG